MDVQNNALAHIGELWKTYKNLCFFIGFCTILYDGGNRKSKLSRSKIKQKLMRNQTTKPYPKIIENLFKIGRKLGQKLSKFVPN